MVATIGRHVDIQCELLKITGGWRVSSAVGFLKPKL